MASSKNRQRALARAKAERQLARRAAAARRRRQWQAGITGGLALVIVVAVSMWVGGVFDDPPPKPDDCVWAVSQTDATGNAELKDVGTPPKRDIPKSGTKTMKIETSQGVIEAVLDVKRAPCAAASYTYLASKNFFDNTKCHKMFTDGGVYMLQCGDPSGTDKGGPTYTVPVENLPPPDPSASASASADPSATASPSASASPSPKKVNYTRGMLALYNNPNTAGSNGSQFLIVYQDSPNLSPPQYSIIGWVTQAGLEVVDKIAATGVEQIGGQEASGGKPKTDVVVQNLTVGKLDKSGTLPTPTATPSATANGDASANPSGSTSSGAAPSAPSAQ